MSNTSNNVVSNGLIGSTVSIGYGAIPPVANRQIYTTNNTGSAGSNGQFLTSTGSNGTSWTTNPYETVMVAKNSPPELEVKGRLVLNGKDLEERLKTIEQVLTIPERDVKLEKKHPKLKKLYDEYITALGKYRTFEAIKGEE
jgi:hypothetical protein